MSRDRTQAMMMMMMIPNDSVLLECNAVEDGGRDQGRGNMPYEAICAVF